MSNSDYFSTDSRPRPVGLAPPLPQPPRQLPICYDAARSPNLETCKEIWFSIGSGDVYFRIEDISTDWWNAWKEGVWQGLEQVLNGHPRKDVMIAAMVAYLKVLGTRVFEFKVKTREDFVKKLDKIGSLLQPYLNAVLTKLAEGSRTVSNMGMLKSRFRSFALHLCACFLDWGFRVEVHGQALSSWSGFYANRILNDSPLPFGEAQRRFQISPEAVRQEVNRALPRKYWLRYDGSIDIPLLQNPPQAQVDDPRPLPPITELLMQLDGW
ncbi:uncharacterized protein JCM6883_000953 [Sporobolomyces salmoneus]|uniref:uncharacterized protein n=1 Tax=Sporobolomyces salmoneus TaxID=183962 RepID=UPI00316C67D3